MDYYSVTLSIICIVDDGEIPEDGYTQDIQVHIVQANDFDEAKFKAIEIGRAEEHKYKNRDDNDVFWRFKEIEYIRKLGKKVTGVEVSTRLETFFEVCLYDSSTKFEPESSDPIMDDESGT